MTTRNRRLLIVSILMFAAALAATEPEAAAENRARPGTLIDPSLAVADSFPHIRSEDSRCMWLVSAGIDSSPTFRRLASQVAASDVIAFVARDLHLEHNIAGSIAFISAAGGYRYVLIR